MRPDPAETARATYLNLSNEMLEHAKLMRDYATTPGNVWLARSELQKIMQLATEMETILQEIKQAEA